MIFDTVKLNSEPGGATLDLYVPDLLPTCTRDAILVIPGGGYNMVCSDREGEPVAQAFLPYGYAAFVLKYSVKEKARFPRPLVEAGLAVAYIRAHADEFGIDPQRIFVIGFSAGGHLTAALGTMWHDPMAREGTDMAYGDNRPNGCIPVYPVVSSDPADGVAGCFLPLLGYLPDRAAKESYSLDKWVDENTVPMFIVHTANDQVVPVRNSILLASACAEHKVPFELHVFADAPHGMSVANKIVSGLNPVFDNPHNAHWVGLAVEWAEALRKKEA